MEQLEHHGILGQKWGVRRYQNPDGSLTDAGRKRQERSEAKEKSKAIKAEVTKSHKINPKKMSTEEIEKAKARIKSENDLYALQHPIKAAMKISLREAAAMGAREGIKGIVQKAIGSIGAQLVDNLLSRKEDVSAYDIKDPSKASKKELDEATAWYRSQAAYEKAKSSVGGSSEKSKEASGNKSDSSTGKSTSKPTDDKKVAPVTLKDLGVKPGDEPTLSELEGLIKKYKSAKHSYHDVNSLFAIIDDNESLFHYGIKGQEWGKRRFETEEGHLTEAGKERYLEPGAEARAKYNSEKMIAEARIAFNRLNQQRAEKAAAKEAEKAKASKPTGEKIQAEVTTKDGKKVSDSSSDETKKKSGKGGKGKSKADSGDKKTTEKQDWRERFAEELKNANLTDEELQEMLERLYPEGKKKIGVGKKVTHSSINDTHYFVQRGSDELYHHGILGQKWGVRRYQNPDGSLTRLGKQRVLNKLGPGGYLNPRQDDKKAVNMKSVSDQFAKEYNEAVKKSIPSGSNPDDYPDTIPENSAVIWDKFKDSYADATLKDLKLQVTDNSRKQVKELLDLVNDDYDLEGQKPKRTSTQEKKKKLADEGLVVPNSRSKTIDKIKGFLNSKKVKELSAFNRLNASLSIIDSQNISGNEYVSQLMKTEVYQKYFEEMQKIKS